MNMIPVNSSNLSKVGYSNGTLYIEFNSGSLYSYSNVPEHIYNSLLSASSKGKYFHAYIKNSYEFTKLN